MDLASLPEVESFEDAVEQCENREKELEQLRLQAQAIQGRMNQLNAELTFYQGAAKGLEPKPNREQRRAGARSRKET